MYAITSLVASGSASDFAEFAHFASPADQWGVLSSFMMGEILFITMALVALVHAIRRGRGHLMLWVGALVAGTANDLIFIAMPLVDNFWHSQGTIMLNPRLPFYIPCVYVCFMYYPTMAARRLGMNRWSTAALSGLGGIVFYSMYDIVGAKNIWWTWHDTDLPIGDRILGAPCSSSLWVITFAGAFSLLADVTLRKHPKPSWGRFFGGLGIIAAFATLVMMVQMFPLQQVDGGAPGYGALAVGFGVYTLVFVIGLARSSQPAFVVDADPRDRMVAAAVGVYFVALFANGVVSDPTKVVSRGVHQEVGECYVEQSDITGLTRDRYLCLTDYEEDFDFSCAEAPPEHGDSWYTICGTPHENRALFTAGIGGIGVVGLLFFGAIFRVRPSAGRDRSSDSDEDDSTTT